MMPWLGCKYIIYKWHLYVAFICGIYMMMALWGYHHFAIKIGNFVPKLLGTQAFFYHYVWTPCSDFFFLLSQNYYICRTATQFFILIKSLCSKYSPCCQHVRHCSQILQWRNSYCILATVIQLYKCYFFQTWEVSYNHGRDRICIRIWNL